MRAAVGSFACLIGLASLASAAALQPTYHVHGYYKLNGRVAMWQFSDASPWQVVKDEPWVDSRLVKWGYVPLTHDSQHYYCLIDDSPRTGSRISEKTFVCGDPETVEVIFNSNWIPKLPLYGAGTH